MKRYFLVVLCVILVILQIYNVYAIIKRDDIISWDASRAIKEVIRCASDTKEYLHNLIHRTDADYQSRMMDVMYGQFKALYHVCRTIDYGLASEFEYIGATFIGVGHFGPFDTNGIYDDFEITENEREYFRELIEILENLCDISGSDNHEKLISLKANLAAMQERIWSKENSPFRLIEQSQTDGQ